MPRQHDKTKTSTSFGFEAEHTKVHEAIVFGHSPLSFGMTPLLTMPRKDNWRHICGRKDLADGQMFVEEDDLVRSGILWLAGVAARVPISLLRLHELGTGPRVFTGFAIMVFALLCAGQMRDGLRKRSARRMLTNHGASEERPSS